MNSLEEHSEVLFEQVAHLIESARHTLLRTTNVTMVTTYFLIGRRIVEHEQAGEQRAQYAQKIIDDLSQKLTAKFGKGFSMRNLEQMRKFYLVYKERIPQNSSAELEIEGADSGLIARNTIEKLQFSISWSHYILLCRIKNAEERAFYEIEAAIGILTHQDLGQMQMYVNYYDRFVKDETENPTIGIILCKDKEDAVVEITLPKDNHQIFATQYSFYLPSKEALQRLIAENG